MQFPFSHHKTTHTLYFFACKAQGSINKIKALNLVYLADRYHLRRYGRPITGDTYFAMPQGPMAHGTKDLMERDPMLSHEERAYSALYITPIDRYDYCATNPEKKPESYTIFSKSDRIALRWTWKTFGSLKTADLAKYTRRYPEWKHHEKSLTKPSLTRIPMSYLDFIYDSNIPGTNPCHPLTNEERDALAAGIQERLHAEYQLS
jgi:hypothetical protein